MVGTKNETNRIKWIREALENIPEGARILDAGAGEQQYKSFCSHLEYVAQDFAQYNGSGDDKGLQMGSWNQAGLDIISDITNIPEADGSFDAILCVEVFEHLPNPVAAIQEFSRLLQRGGYLILTAPFCSLTHFSPYHFYSGFNRYFYETYLDENYFEIIEIISNGNFFEYLAQEIRRAPLIAKRYCNITFRAYESLAIKILLKILQRFTNRDTGSDELLCFGYHILARKK